MRPNFCQIEWIDVICFSFFLRHDLDTYARLGKITLCDSINEIALRVIRILSPHLTSLFAREVLDALLGLEMPLHIKELISTVDQTILWPLKSSMCQPSGVPQSEKRIVTWCKDSGESDQKSHITSSAI